MSDNKRNNDLSYLVLLTGKVLFCLIINMLSTTAERQNCARNSLATREMSTLLRVVISAGMWGGILTDRREAVPDIFSFNSPYLVTFSSSDPS